MFSVLVHWYIVPPKSHTTVNTHRIPPQFSIIHCTTHTHTHTHTRTLHHTRVQTLHCPLMYAPVVCVRFARGGTPRLPPHGQAHAHQCGGGAARTDERAMKRNVEK
jgi:hypothetical protein